MKGLLAQLEELAWNLPPGPFSLIPDLLGEETVSSSGSRDDRLQGWAAGWGWLLYPHGVAWTSQGGSSSSLGQKWEASPRLTRSVLCPHPRGCCSPASGKGTWKSSTLSTTLTQSSCLLPWPFTHVTAPTISLLFLCRHQTLSGKPGIPLIGSGGIATCSLEPCVLAQESPGDWEGRAGSLQHPVCSLRGRPLSFRSPLSTRAGATQQLAVIQQLSSENRAVRSGLPSSALCKIKATPLVPSVSADSDPCSHSPFSIYSHALRLTPPAGSDLYFRPPYL